MISKRQKEILDFIIFFQNKHDYAPSLEEIKNKFKFSSVSTAHFHISNLQNMGLLDKEENKPRAINATHQENVINIPISGTIAAGFPIEAIETKEFSVAVSQKDLSSSSNYYALRVKGDSMIEEGIFNGDIVVIKNQAYADNGETVVAIVNENEATLKKFYREKNLIKLQPANQNTLPLFFKEIEIRGVVVKIIRNLEYSNKNLLSTRKQEFLEKIKSKNPESQNKYKRVALSPIRYAGGKSLAVGHVIELLPESVKKVVSPFFGGGSIEIAMSKYLGLEVIGYDIFDILCNYWNFQIENPQLLCEKLKLLKPNKKQFEEIRKILNQVWRGERKLDPLTLAVYYVYNFNLSYGPGFMGWSSDIYLDQKKYIKMIEKIRDFQPGNLKVKCADFRDILKKHQNDFLYCDPPYYIGSDSKMFRGIYPMRNIPVHHDGFPHEELRDILKKHKGGFILSYNNCPTILDYYKDYDHFFPTWQYTMGQGETRIGKNRIKNGDNHIKESHELIIYCPPKL
ncbi:MAG: hypothetical protein Athens101428_39 [Candidatus Berkelbacteria bacterium Athens1014_28]|uniref:LexA repressor n=1 Tax=Candidatus Berkelbacteria bacterium Athens1014_28 TaxID=2017145 RepID=A0A554LR12_9BACT|nr:MAG: hypothetical protein Athens101428_39 [Candidatus Berkelbacteria bacterium Athens1014_28]